MKTLIKNTFTTYNNTINLITHIVERHFSILNKFKHLLVFGTLALSLNVTSGDVNQFNKQAYLDLNTEYDWNQPQSYYRKDNQATTLLKETVGIIHGAVGSTDSDNVNQLSDKITTGIQSQIRNRAINDTIRKTEGMINNKANELANRFGAGRTEISISGIASQDLQYSIKTIQPIYPLDKNNKELVFFHGQFTLGENHGEHRNITNLGIGKRFLLDSGRSIAGINLFGDYEAKSEHRRLGFGLEYIRTNFSTHLNTYHSLSDKKIIGGYTEEVLAGYDVKLSGQAPYLPWAKIKGTYYYWDAKAGANIKGNIFGIEIGVSPSTRFEFGTENSSIADRVNYMQLSVALPISKNDKFTNFFIDNKPFRAIGIMNLNDLHYVERTNKIRIEKVLNAIFTINAIADAEVTENTAFTGSRPSLSNAPIGKLIYTLGGADAAGFSIDSSTGIISMVARDFEVPADANTDNIYEVTIIATDINNNTDSETQTVTVTDVTETATFTINPIADVRVAENTAFTGSRPSLSGNTPIGKLTYTLAGADATDFSIDSSTGIISMVARNFEAPADANTDNVYEVTIIATDVDNNTDSETQTVTVTDASETVAFTINPIADARVAENTAFTGSRPSLSGNAPIGKLTYTLAGADATDFAIDSSTGIISMVARNFEAPADTNTDNVYEVTIVATDVDNNRDSESQRVTVTDVTVADVPEIATFTINPIADARVAENTAFTGSRPSLSGDTPIGKLTYTLGGVDAADFAIDSSTGIVSMVARDFEVPADANTDNIYEVTIIATDVDNNTDSETQTVTVTDAAETATFTINPIADARITENTAFTGSRPSLSGDTPIGKLTYTLGGADAADFSIDSSTGIISMVARDFGVPDDANIDNVYEVIIIATDVDNNTDSETQTVAITFVSETILFKGLTYKTIASPDRNRVWLDRNLGATRVATSSTDSAAYGHLYQWGRNDDGHEDRTNANTSTTLANGIINAGTTLFIKKTFIPYDWTRADSSGAARSSAWEVDGTNNVCPAGFSVPTEADMNADTLSAITTKIINKAVAFSSFLKLPVAGFRFSEHGLFGSVGNYGHYWTRSTEGTRSRTLDFRDDQAYFHGNYRAHGMSVRCIKG
ncbi:Cadherin domain protein [uncultured Gammaproteobacteria bacterium]|nr:Cadherin domain protein [uncultured Gammaproteobacteria bacterium]CAC9636711.1 Cadherin domain protein [uncultured Gammaproteobacteria bacterium]